MSLHKRRCDRLHDTCCWEFSCNINPASSGEELYPLVAEMDSDNAGKITGMLLEMTEADVISIIEDRQACEEKVSTPFSTLNQAEVVMLSQKIVSLMRLHAVIKHYIYLSVFIT